MPPQADRGVMSAAQKWVEEHFPIYSGNMKAALMLAFGAGAAYAYDDAIDVVRQRTGVKIDGN